MAVPTYVYPDEVRPTPNGVDAVGAKAYEYPVLDETGAAVTQSLSAAGSTPWIVTPRGISDVCLLLQVVSGSPTAKIEISYDRVDDVRAGNAVGISLASVTATTRYELKPPTAVRMTFVSGTGVAKIHYRAQ